LEITILHGGPREEQRRTITGVSNAEINRELTALKRMFNLAIQAGKLLQRPHSAIESLPGSQSGRWGGGIS
jgi:hypothetical protein